MSKFHDHTIVIAASRARIWRMLTDPALTAQYMFGCATESDWRVGSPLDWRAGGVTYVKGTIVEIVPEQKLVYTVFDPQSSIPDVPENYLTVTYELTPDSDGKSTRLRILQGDYATVADGEKRYGSPEGWGPLLAKMKALAESD